MPDRTKKVVIFAGAGASKAVNASQFPTTPEFFAQLPDSIKGDRLFQLVVDYLRSIEKLEVIDIEQILWNLQALDSFYSNVTKPADIITYSIAADFIGILFKGNGYGDLRSISPHISERVINLVSKINSLVFELYGYEPEPAELLENWIPLLDWLMNGSAKVDIFTTNYDTVIETTAEIISGADNAAFMQGLVGRRRKRLDLSQWMPISKRKPGLLTKLHGSLDWKLHGQEIYVGDALFTGDHKRQAIIYPGFKGDSDLPFFSTFHDYLGRALAEADYVAFIGFAFRDPHIDEIIRESLNPAATVVIVNPAKSVNFPVRRANVERISRKFDIEAVKYLQALIDV